MRGGVLGVAAALALAACGGTHTPPPAGSPITAARPADVAPALEALRAARFADAVRAADATLAAQPDDATAAATRALARTIEAYHAFLDAAEAALRQSGGGLVDHARMRSALDTLERALGDAQADLVVASRAPGVALELCLACWERDWNRSGDVDDRDRRLFEIELDAAGQELPERDPRRRPTFRFDVGDLHWARAMLAFQRAAIDLALAYRWDELDRLAQSLFAGPPPRITIRLGDRARVDAAKARLLEGLDAAAATRIAYLAETDDDREWVPNPTQKDHPMPLPVDAALFETWDGVVRDLRALVAGEQGLSLAELGALAGAPAELSGY